MLPQPSNNARDALKSIEIMLVSTTPPYFDDLSLRRRDRGQQVLHRPSRPCPRRHQNDGYNHLLSGALLPGVASMVAWVEASTKPSRELKKRVEKVVKDVPGRTLREAPTPCKPFIPSGFRGNGNALADARHLDGA